MPFRTLPWQAYRVVRNAAKWTKLTEVPFGGSTLGRRLGRLTRRIVARVSGSKSDSAILAHGHRMFLTGWEDGTRPFLDLLVDHYEEETTHLVERVLSPGMMVADIGAHVGYYTLIAARCVGPKGKVYAFEPEARNYAALRKNIELNGYGNVLALEMAVSDHTGSASLFISTQPGRHSLFRSSPQDTRGRRMVQSTTLDDFLRGQGWPSMNLIKLDIEGGEPAALRGMTEALERSPDLRLIVEFSPDDLAAAGVHPQDFLDQLRGFGFKMFVLKGKSPTPLESVNVARLVSDLAGDRYVNLLCQKDSSLPW